MPEIIDQHINEQSVKIDALMEYLGLKFRSESTVVETATIGGCQVPMHTTYKLKVKKIDLID